MVGLIALEPGDIAYSKLRPYLRKSFLVNEPLAGTSELITFVPRQNLECRYLFYVTQSQPWLDWADLSSTGTKMPRTSAAAMLDFRLELPPLEEQRRIANYLDAATARIDAVVGLCAQHVELIEERDCSLVDALVDPPSTGVTIPLARVARLQSGLTVDGQRSLKGARDYPYLRVANVQADELDLSEVKMITVPLAVARRSLLRRGDVLMTEGGDIDKLGRGTVWRGEIDGCLHQNHVFAVRTDPRRLLPEYLALLTRCSSARRYFESTGVRSTNLASTSSSKVLAFPIAMTAIDAQRTRVNEYARIHDVHSLLRSRMRSQIALLAERRQALITAAVTGQFDVSSAA